MGKGLVLLLAVPGLIWIGCGAAWSWCWLRDTGKVDTACPAGSYQTACCAGNLRVWTGGGMTYQISTSTADVYLSSIRTGMSKWNEVEMAVFSFTEGARSAAFDAVNDGVNLVNLDSSWCAHQGCPSGGVLGFSMTWTVGDGTVNYRATESDIILNGEEFTWGDGSGGTINTAAVVAHEAGHNAGLSHPGGTCRASGSSGCGPEMPSATMYYSYDGGQPTDKSSLELDDVAALVHGYPRSFFRVRVLDQDGVPAVGATVDLLDTAAPVNGSDITSGGSVKGDVTNGSVLFGDKTAGDACVNSTPFTATDANGYTNYINPVHRTFRIRAHQNDDYGGQTVTVPDGTSEVTVSLVGQLPYVSPAWGDSDVGRLYLYANVNPNGLPTTCYFEYGRDGALNMRTASMDAGSGTANFLAQTTVGDVAQSAQYTFRAVAVNLAGTTYSAIQTINTEYEDPAAGALGGAAGGCFVEAVNR
ncbi:MAG: hypothetical protein AB1641_25510 [Thermodesulfobacteriota bacterium]